MFIKSRFYLSIGLALLPILQANAQAGGMEITYTDGSKQAVSLNQESEKIKIIEFKKSTGSSTTKPNNDNVFGSDTFTTGSLKGEIFFISEVNRIPDLDNLRPVGQPLYATSLNITARRFDQGFPGIPGRTEWFAIKYTGSFFVANEGMYNFRTVSDDGVILKIDNRVVIDDGGVHAPQSATGQVYLNRGEHNIRVDYFQGPKYDLALQLFVTPSGQNEKLFDTRDFK
ncbi:MAG: PA14 domain-containing protein [Gallionella sp.]|nr:PA14 domain-containing protein [Gallionella sp.]